MAKAKTAKRLSIDKLKVAHDVQPRVALDNHVVKEYAERIEAGEKFPEIEAFFDGETYWLAEGFHRLAAHKRLGHKMIECIVIEGDKNDAQWHAIQSNKDHGLRRTNEDKQRAVEMALKHPRGKDLTDRGIAELVGVSATMVGKHRKAVEPTVQSAQSKIRVDRKGRKMDTAKIGTTKKAKAQPKKTELGKEADPDADTDTDGQNESRKAKVSDDLLKDIDELVKIFLPTVGTILRHEEVTSLPEKHHLPELLRRLENVGQSVSAWLMVERTKSGHESPPATTEPNEVDEPAQDNDEGIAEWTA